MDSQVFHSSHTAVACSDTPSLVEDRSREELLFQYALILILHIHVAQALSRRLVMMMSIGASPAVESSSGLHIIHE